MKIAPLISKIRNQYSFDLLTNDKYWTLSATTLSLFKTIKLAVDKYAKGRVLDAGAGSLNAKSLLHYHCNEYVSFDIEKRNKDVDLIGDIQSMKGIRSVSFDTVYSSQVLEHIPRPWDALSEIYRILKPGGYVIISVPHLSGLHEEPFDFYRYTPYGIRFLMEKAGFVVKEEYRAGGLISFISHPFSLLSVSAFWLIPGIRWVYWWINKVFLVHPSIKIDKMFNLVGKFPSNIVIVGKKGIH